MSKRIASLALITALAGAPSVALADTKPVAVEVQKSAAPAPASQSESSTYAEREAQDKKAAEFEGGNVVIVMSGTALVALVLILLII